MDVAVGAVSTGDPLPPWLLPRRIGRGRRSRDVTLFAAAAAAVDTEDDVRDDERRERGGVLLALSDREGAISASELDASLPLSGSLSSSCEAAVPFDLVPTMFRGVGVTATKY